MKNFLLLFFFACCLSVQGQVVVDFTASSRTGCGQLLTTFSFTITGNTNSIVSENWDLGDGTSGGGTAGHLYTYNAATPCYTVTLTLTDAAGLVYTKVKSNYICVYGKPTADYMTTDSRTGCAPLAARLIDQSVATAGGQIVAWQWSSNGGTPTTVGMPASTIPAPGIPNPLFTWNTTGAYAPALTVTDNNGCKATVQKNGFITVTPTPVASFTSTVPSACTAPHTVTFTNTTATGGAPSVTYEWVIGGTNFVGTTPPPQTFTAGVYDVMLIAKSGVCRDTMLRPAYINVGGNAAFSFTPSSGCAGTTVSFTPPVGSTDWVWNFCDGQSSTDENPTHTFWAANTPTCCYPSLTATLPGGCRFTAVSPTPICINAVPLPDFTADRTNFCSLPAVVNFTTTVPTNPNITCLWNMGDLFNTTSTSCGNQTHTYTAADFVGGVATVSLTWTDEFGCAGTKIITLNYKPLVSAFTLSKVEGCVPYNTTIANTNLSTIFGSPNTYNWYVDNVLYSTAPTPTPSIYTFAQVIPCTHDIKLVVSNTLGCSDSITKTIKGGTKPTAALSFSPTTVCAGSPVTFDVSGSTAAPSPCPLDNKMYLNYQDGSISTTFTTSPISHLYRDTVSYCRRKPYLVVYSGGCASDTARAGCLTVYPTVAKFGMVRTCTDKTLINLSGINNSTFSNCIGCDTYDWQVTPSAGVIFETGQANGTAAQAAQVGLRFANTGTYTVVLTSSNLVNGCTSSTSRVFTVANPVANFTMSPTQGCAPLQVNLTNTTTDVANVLYYNWGMNPQPVAPQIPPIFTSVINPNPSATFYTPGAYDGMQLTITDVNGCTSTAIQNGIQVQGVTADFNILPQQSCLPANVVFTDNSVVFPANATIINYAWDLRNDHLPFAGAATGSGNYYEYSSPTANTAAYNFTNPGAYQMKHVIKTLVNGVTCSDSILKLGFTGYKPVAYFTAPTDRCAGQTLPIANNSAGTGGVTHTWSINGVTDPTLLGPTPTISFPIDGDYVLCDNVIESNLLACPDSMCKTIHVRTPIIDFTGTNLTAPCPPLNPSLISTSQNLSNIRWEIWKDIMDYSTTPPTFLSIDYTEGLMAAATTTSSNPFDFVLTAPGYYTVKLFGTNASGCRDSLVRNAYISIGGTSGTLTVSPTSGCAPLVVTFSLTDIVNTTNIAYSLGSGLGVVVHNVTGTSDVLNYTYTQAGTYSPAFLMSDGIGCDIAINAPTITVDSSSGWVGITNNTVCIGDSTLLYASSVAPGATYHWQTNGSFDPAFANNSSIMVAPTVTTLYYVTINDSNGCAKVATITVNVKPYSLPILSISPTNTALSCAGMSVMLNASATQDGSAIAMLAAYNWNTTSTGLSAYIGITNPSAQPSQTTTYTVTVTGFGNCSASASVNITVPDTISGWTTLVSNTTFAGGSAVIRANSTTAGTTYHWQTNSSFDPATANNATITVNPSVTTVYTVTITAPNGCTKIATISVNVSSDCVFSGDANHDQIADNFDLLPIALRNNTIGQTRPNATINWQCELMTNWFGMPQDTALANLKHSDCNGNGTIEATDTLAILQNYNRTHNGFVATNKPLIQPALYLDFGRTTITPTEYPYIVSAEIYVGDTTMPVQNLAGLAFTIDYNNTVANSAKFKANTNGFLGSNVFHLNKNITVDSLSYLDIAVARSDGLSSNGGGSIGTVEFTITDNIIGKGITTAELRARIGAVRAITPQNIDIPLNPEKTSIKIENMVDFNLPTKVTAPVSISPNPNNGILKIKNNGNFLSKIVIHDAIGREVFAQDFAETAVNPSLNIQYLSNGVYFVTIFTNNNGIIENTVQRLIRN